MGGPGSPPGPRSPTAAMAKAKLQGLKSFALPSGNTDGKTR